MSDGPMLRLRLWDTRYSDFGASTAFNDTNGPKKKKGIRQSRFGGTKIPSITTGYLSPASHTLSHSRLSSYRDTPPPNLRCRLSQLKV
ncbi:hypothetical protein VTH06DRAFT_5236 [Thermothelomyces fergusii]